MKETAKAAPAKEAAPKAEAKKPVRRTKKAAAAAFGYEVTENIIPPVQNCFLLLTGKFLGSF